MIINRLAIFGSEFFNELYHIIVFCILQISYRISVSLWKILNHLIVNNFV